MNRWCLPRTRTEIDLTDSIESISSEPLVTAVRVATPARAGAATTAASPLTEELSQAVSLRLKGTTRMDVRAKRKVSTDEVVFITDSDEEVPKSTSRRQRGVLRISAGRAAAVAGIHPYAEVGEIFLELLYQDLPELLLDDAKLAGVEVISPEVERERLMEKSGEAAALKAALQAAQRAQNVEAAQDAQQRLREAVAKAKAEGKVNDQEAAELQQTLQLEVNLDFGARHEDSAIERYQKKVGADVYGQQKRVFLPMPADGPNVALCQAFPPPARDGALPRDQQPATTDQGAKPLFYLTGYVDGLVDVPRNSPAPVVTCVGAGSSAPSVPDETLVVEVKHRMGRIKDPPEIYDIVQLCSYCRALGCLRGDLVQCLRQGTSGDVLHVKRIDFSEGSPDRTGFDQHVLPNLYSAAQGVYAARHDQAWRVKLLQAAPEERRQIIGQLCPHLG